MSKRRRALTPLAVALVSDAVYQSTPVYTEASRRKLRAVAESTGTLVRTGEATVSDKPWSSFPNSAFDMGQWHKSCVLHRHDGEPMAKTDCSLPVREPSGTLNRNAVHAAAGRIGMVKGATAEQKKAAAKSLVAAYKQLGEDAPQSVTDLTEAVAAEPRGRVAVTETSGSMAPTSTPGNVRIALIRAGWSLNGSYYGADVLKASAGKWRKGLQAFCDHAPDSEENDYPSGSIKNLAGVLTSDAVWNPATQCLEADVKLFQPWREALTDMAPYIGMSIRAWVYAEDGEAEGRRGMIVTSIAEARSVDFVTVPAAGGAILSVLESVNRRNAAEATVEERRSALAYVIAEKYGDEETYTWVRDYDPDRFLVWFDTCPRGGENTTWQQSYTAGDGTTVALSGEPVEVIPRTVYDPAPADPEPDGPAVPAPYMPGMAAGEAATTAEDLGGDSPAADVTDGAPPTVTDPPIEEETGMPETQTGGAAPPEQAGTAPVVDTPTPVPNPASEAANRAVLEAMQALTAQVTALTEANQALTVRANERDAEARTARNAATAREAVTVALSAPEVPADLRQQIAPRVTAAVLACVPVGESGDVDSARLAEAVTAAIAAESGYAAQLLESAGVGRPAGLGSAPVQPKSGEDFIAAMTESFRNIGMDEKSARIAAVGRG